MTVKNDVALAVIRIPAILASRDDVSVYSLIVASGYPDNHNAVQVEDIERALRSYPACITDWLNYSEDKRSSGGWYFKTRDKDGGWVVGHTGGSGPEHTSAYTDEAVACATFIKKELDAICLPSR